MVPNNKDYKMDEILQKYPEIMSGEVSFREMEQLHEDILSHYNWEEYVDYCRKSSKDTQVGGSHYKHYSIQPIDIIVQNGLSFLEGCILKRLHRWRHKGTPIEDLQKMKQEIDLLIELEAMPEVDRGGGIRG